MRELNKTEVENVSGGALPHYVTFLAGAAVSSQVGRVTDYVVDDIVSGFQSPVVNHPHQDGRAF